MSFPSSISLSTTTTGVPEAMPELKKSSSVAKENSGITKASTSNSIGRQVGAVRGYGATATKQATRPLSEHLITNTTSAMPAPEFTREEIAVALNQVTTNLAPFFQTCDEKNASKIFLFDEKATSIELHENTISSDAGDIVLEASHETAKEFFINQLTTLYGKTVVDFFYPEECRKEALTLGNAHLIREQINAFQQSLETACQGDPSKYEVILQTQLETLHQIEKTVETAFQGEGSLKTEVASLEKYLSEQIGISAEAVHTCLLAGTAIAAVAATASGLALPAALHAAAAATLSHSGLIGAAAAAGTKATPLAASLSSKAAAMSSAAAHHSVAYTKQSLSLLEIYLDAKISLGLAGLLFISVAGASSLGNADD